MKNINKKLIAAIDDKDGTMVAELLKIGADPNYFLDLLDRDIHHPYFVTCKLNRQPIETPLIRALFTGYFPVVEQLIIRGAQIQPHLPIDADDNPFTDLFLRFDPQITKYIVQNCEFKLNEKLLTKIFFRTDIDNLARILDKFPADEMIRLITNIEYNLPKILGSIDLTVTGWTRADFLEKIDFIKIHTGKNYLENNIPEIAEKIQTK